MKKAQVERLVAAQALKSGQAAAIVGGKNRGDEGVVFFVGNTKFGKERVGVKRADGVKVWARPDQVIAIAGQPKPVVAEQPTLPVQPAVVTAPKPANELSAAAAARWQAVLDLQAEVAVLKQQVAELMVQLVVLQTAAKPTKRMAKAQLAVVDAAARTEVQ